MANFLRRLRFKTYLDEKGIREEATDLGLTGGKFIISCNLVTVYQGSKFWFCSAGDQLYFIGDNGYNLSLISHLPLSILGDESKYEIKKISIKGFEQIKPIQGNFSPLFVNTAITGATTSFVNEISHNRKLTNYLIS